MWNETEISNFKGMNRSVGASKVEAHTILNLDPRGRQGELTNSPGFVNTYAAPVYPNVYNALPAHQLGVKTFFMSQFDKDDQREVTLVVQKGVVSAVSGSGIANKQLLLMSIRPYWDSTQWVDGWQWLNEVVMTKIVSVNEVSIMTLSGFPTIKDPFPYGWRIEDITNPLVGVGTIIEVLNDGRVQIDKTGWVNGDTVYLYRNYIPKEYLEGMFDAMAKDVHFHNILNDLRFACGGFENRVGLSIGYRNRSFDIKEFKVNPYPSFTPRGINGLVVDPYFPLDDGSDIYNIQTGYSYVYDKPIVGETDEEISKLSNTFYNILDECYFVLVANLDGYNSYKVAEGTLTIPIWHAKNWVTLQITPKIDFARMNKRTTSFDLYMATGSGGQRNTDYFLVRNFDLQDYDRTINTVLGDVPEYIIIDSDGYLLFVEDGTGSDLVVPTIGNQVRGARVTYADWTLGQGTKLIANLGYKPTLNYVKSWDLAIVSQDRTHLLNGYIDKRYENILFFSPYGGSGAPMTDVITTGNFHNLESRDGNNVIGLDVLPNMDLLAIKQNSKQTVDPQSGAVRDLSFGNGSISAKSIVNFGDRICWASEYGVIASDGINDFDVTKNINELYQGIIDKTAIIAVREEKENGYRINAPLAAAEGGTSGMLFLKDFGWLKTKLYELPNIIAYDTNKDGNAVALDRAGKVWTLDYDVIPGVKPVTTRYPSTDEYGKFVLEEVTVGSPTQFIWQSTPMDISLLGEGIKDTNRLILGKLWIDYNFSSNCTFYYRLDGGAWVSKIIPSTQTHFSWSIAPGQIGRVIEIAVGGFYDNTWGKLRIKAIGLLWKPMYVGRFG